MSAQILLNGLMLGAIYACIAVGFSLVWGVLNVINMVHGAFIILGGYLTFFAWLHFKIHPFLMILPAALLMFGLGYVLQRGMINKVISKPVLTTLTLTFGLEMILYNAMNLAFSATPRRIALDMGLLSLGELLLPVDRIASMVLALSLTGLLYLVLRTSKIGRAIVAVRMDRADLRGYLWNWRFHGGRLRGLGRRCLSCFDESHWAFPWQGICHLRDRRPGHGAGRPGGWPCPRGD
jgi:branched-chain amino acid transport system permease protein